MTAPQPTLEYARPTVRRAPGFLARLALALLAVYVPHLWLLYTQRNDWEWQALWLKRFPLLPGLIAATVTPDRFLFPGMIALTVAVIAAASVLSARMTRSGFLIVITCLAALAAANSVLAWRVLSD
jgi:hypothetical protein